MAQRLDLDPIVVRILAILIAAITFGLGALAYIVLWALLPQDPPSSVPYDVSPEQAESSAYGCVECSNCSSSGHDSESLSIVVWLAIVICLVLLFLVVVLCISPMVRGSDWWQFWPIGLVIGGVCLVVVPVGGPREMAWHALGVSTVALATACLPMSLGIVSWYTHAFAFEHLWLLAAAAVVLCLAGFYYSNGALAVVSTLLVVVYCLLMLTTFAIPGDVANLLISMPDGRSLRIAITKVMLLF